MGGIDNVNRGTGPLSVFKATSIDATPKADPGQTGTPGTADANRATGGLGVLKTAAADAGLTAYRGVDLSFQDRTPTNGGSSVTPAGTGGGSSDGGLTVFSTAIDLSKEPSGTTGGWSAVIEPIKEFVSTITRVGLGKAQSFGSWGDPHEVTGSGLKFDNQLTGRFVAFKSDEGDLEVQKDQGPDARGRWPGATLIHQVAMKVGTNRIRYDADSDTVMVNGKAVPMKDGISTLDDGTSLAFAGNKLSITSPRGDVVTISKMDGYLDLSGTISGKRPRASVQGSLGNFDGDQEMTNDLVARDGTVTVVELRESQGWSQIVQTAKIDAFLESWRLKAGESLF